jgi:hypothetical protein
VLAAAFANAAMRLYVGITDHDWYRFLSGRPDLDEVNFWQPSGSRTFRVLQPGEPLLFKLHSPLNFIVGGGFLARYSPLPVEIAWDAFGQKNGAVSLEEILGTPSSASLTPAAIEWHHAIYCKLIGDSTMVQLTNIHSLSDFQRNTKEHLKRLKRSGDPEVLTVNGKAELVVQDARSYQKLLNQAAEAEAIEILKRRLKAVARSAKSRPLEEVLEELGRKYESPRKRA